MTDVPTPEELNAQVFGTTDDQPSVTSEEVARRMFGEHVIAAASIICDAVKGKDVSKTSYDAAKYIVERTLGRPSGGKGAYREMFAELGVE